MIFHKLLNKDLLILVLITVLFSYETIINNIYVSTCCILLLLVLNILFSLKNIKERIVFFVFQISFFTFLLGRLLLYNFFPDNNLFIYGFVFSNDTMRHILTSLFVSLLFVRLGYFIFEKTNYDTSIKTLDYENRYNVSIRKIAMYSMYLTLLPQLFILIEKVFLVQRLGYEAYYTDYVSQLPFAILKLGLLYEPMTYLFLATMPSKRECRFPLIIFFVVGCISLGYGQRNGFLLNSIFILIYLVIRDQINSGGIVWFKRKYLFYLVILMPFLLTYAMAFSFYRSGEKFESISFIENTVLFFFSQGNSASLIGHAKDLEKIIPENMLYSLGPVISFLKENAVTKLFFNVPQYSSMTPDLALNSHAFSFAISYLVNPVLYLNGGALGSCYIAELWVDFGFVGIAAGSFILGILMARFISLCRRNVWLTTISFSGAIMIIYAPRAEFMGFLQLVLSFGTLLAFAFIHFLAKSSTSSE